MEKLHENYPAPLRKGNTGILGTPEKEREKKAESLFKETMAEKYPNLGKEQGIQAY